MYPVAGPIRIYSDDRFYVRSDFEVRRTDRGVRIATLDGLFHLDQVEHLFAALGGCWLRSGIGIRVRGSFSSTWNPKPYAVETWDEYDNDKTTKPLGLPGESDWVLYYPHPLYDRQLIANTFSWELSRLEARTRQLGEEVALLHARLDEADAGAANGEES